MAIATWALTKSTLPRANLLVTSTISRSGKNRSFALSRSDSNWRRQALFLAVSSRGMAGSFEAIRLSCAICSADAPR